MGIVYHARQVRLNRIVALKLIRDPDLAGYVELKRFRAEAHAIAQLDHPNIIPIYEVGQDEDLPYFSMKLIEGGNLKDHLPRLKENPSVAATLMAKVARAVHFAHQRAILHRDIKPTNILLDSDDVPFVTDFGLAKQLGPESASAATVTGAVMGTPAYMPPEQAQGGTKSVTTAADVYGLGATLYETLTGLPPFAGESVAEILRCVLDEAPRRPRTLNALVDRDLETICLKCLEKEPARRYGSAEKLAEDLERWLDGRSIEARASSTLEQAAKWVRRHRAMAALIGLSTLLLLLAVVGGALGTLMLWELWNSAEDRLYINEVDRARRDIISHLPVLAGEILDKQAPGDSWQPDRRGFEWYFLRRLCKPRELRGHEGIVRSIAIDRTGGLLVSCGEDNTLRVWDLDSGSTIATARQERVPRAVALSPDGRWVACGGFDKKVTIYDVATLREHPPIGPLSESVWAIDFSHDSRRIAFSLDNSVHVVDIESRRDAYYPISLPAIHAQALNRSHALAFSHDGLWLAISGGSIVVCSAETGERLRTLEGQARPISSLVFSPDNRLLASAGEDGTIQVWDPATGEHRLDCGNGGDVVQGLAFSPGGEVLASAGPGRMAHFWNAATGADLRTFGHPREVQAVAFHPDRRRLATASSDGAIRVWDISDEESIALEGHCDPVVAVAVRPDGRQIASIGSDRSLAFWDVDPRLKIGSHSILELPFVPKATSYSPDGRKLVVAGSHGHVQIWDVQERRLFNEFNDPKENTFLTVAYSPDGVRLVAAGAGGAVRILDSATASLQYDSQAQGDTVCAAAYSPDGLRIATAGGDGLVRLWDSRTMRLVQILKGHTKFVIGLAFSFDGRFLASADAAHAVLLWDLERWQVTPRPLGHSEQVLSLAFSPGRQRLRLATAGVDRTIRLWDTTTGLQVLTMSGHTNDVTAVAFGPEGRYLVTASRDKTLRLWNAGP